MAVPGHGIDIEILVFGDTQVARRLLRFSESAGNLAPLWASMYEDLLLIETAQFLTEGGHGSAGWPELAESTVKEKKAKGEEPWILRATEELFRSMTEPDAEGQIHDVAPDFMRFGTNIPYGIYHQSDAPRQKLPQRKIMDITEVERVALVKKLQAFLMTGEVVAL